MAAENTSYRGKQILIGLQSDLTGNVLSKAVDISAFVTEFTSNETPQTKEVMPMSSGGQQSSTITGSTKYNGTMNMSIPRALLPLIIRGVYGKPTTSQALTADAWITLTSTLKGDIVKLTGGKYLVAQNAGTTGATEPTITTEVDYQDLATLDGTVKWKLRNALYERLVHKTGFCTDKFVIIQRRGEGCGSLNVSDKIFENVDLTYFTISKQDGAVAADQSIPFMAETVRRSSQVDFVDVTVTTTLNIREDYWKQDDILIRVNGAKYGTLLNFELTYTRNVTQADSTEPFKQIQYSDAPTLTGTGTIRYDPIEYEKLLPTQKYAVTIAFDGIDGEYALFEFPATQFHTPAEDIAGAREIWMKFEMKPTGNATTPMGTVDIKTSLNIG